MIARRARNPGMPVKTNVGNLPFNSINVPSAAIAVTVSEFNLLACFWQGGAYHSAAQHYQVAVLIELVEVSAQCWRSRHRLSPPTDWIGLRGVEGTAKIDPVLRAGRVGKPQGVVVLTEGRFKGIAQFSELSHSALPHNRMGQSLGTDGLRDLLGGVARPAPDRQRVSALPLESGPVGFCCVLQVLRLHPAPPNHDCIRRQLPSELMFEITQ